MDRIYKKKNQERISVEQRMKRYNMKRGRNEDPTEFSMTVWIEYCNRADLYFLEGALFMKCRYEIFCGVFQERLVRGELQGKIMCLECRLLLSRPLAIAFLFFLFFVISTSAAT